MGHYSFHWEQQWGIIPYTNANGRALFLLLTPTMGHILPTHTNNGALFLLLTLIMALFLPLTLMIGDYSWWWCLLLILLPKIVRSSSTDSKGKALFLPVTMGTWLLFTPRLTNFGAFYSHGSRKMGHFLLQLHSLVQPKAAFPKEHADSWPWPVEVANKFATQGPSDAEILF